MRDLFDEFDDHDEDHPELLQWSFDDYEGDAMQFAVYDVEVMYPLIGLVSEVGEVVSDWIEKHRFQDKGRAHRIRKPKRID